SAASRAYIPRSLWARGVRDELAAATESLTYGNVTDLSNFGGAVIDRRAFNRLAGVLQRLRASSAHHVEAGGQVDDSVGFFVRPTVVRADDPTDEVFVREYFGPILAVHVYQDSAFEDELAQLESISAYGLTGAIFSTDRSAVERAMNELRFAAGNFYVNDKPTGAVVGQQPFGGSRASGTNDKAGSAANMMRWVSPRAIKETFVPPTDHRYPHMRES
ncbi:MAG: aldehyde dehydrogenase family protein, partial [Actinobacteria bacterium]|nr:aldehyde dehydrogenase family protein [Actinomycetota bacterium]